MMASTTALANRCPVPAAVSRTLPSESVSGAVVQFSSRRSSVRRDHASWRSALCWTDSGTFGKTSLFVPFASSTTGVGLSNVSLQVTAFTPEQSKMVKDSWKLLQKKDAGEQAMKFFLKVFEIAPSVKRMFHFLDDASVPIEKNPKLKIHALQVFVLTGQSAAQLGEKGALEALAPKLVELGQTHVGYGVVDEHFDVVKFALLVTLAEALPEEWSPELKEAWSLSYDEVVNRIKAEMKELRARQAGASVEIAGVASLERKNIGP